MVLPQERINTMRYDDMCDSIRTDHEQLRCNIMTIWCRTMQYGSNREAIRIRPDAMWRSWELPDSHWFVSVRSTPSYCIVVHRVHIVSTPGQLLLFHMASLRIVLHRIDSQRTDRNWHDVRRCSMNRLQFAEPIRLFWTFQNNHIGLRLWPI